MSKSSNQVSFKIDSRLFYTLIAVLAVLGIFAIGMWIGQQVSNPQAPASGQAMAPASGGAVQAPPVDPANPGVVVGATPAAAGAAAEKGRPPVPVEEQPVGPNEPRLAIEEINSGNNYTFDLGSIPADVKTEKTFTLKNVGTSTLVIESTTASCGCTAAVADKKELAPGETTALHVAYDPRVNQEFGKFVQKQVRVKSNDPVVPLVEYTITAEVAAQ